MTPVLIMPGLGGSGPAHWQTRWQEEHPAYLRVSVPDWERPERDVWVSALAEAVRDAPAAPVVVAHSLGCLVVAELGKRGIALHAALLVAPPDPQGPQFPEVAGSFRELGQAPLAFPSRLVASHNDPYASFAFAERCASAWGSVLFDLGMAGHINADSNLGTWPEGQRLLRELLA